MYYLYRELRKSREAVASLPQWKLRHRYHTCCDTGPQFFGLIWSPFSTYRGMWRVYFNTDSHGSPVSRLLRQTKRYGGAILTWILTSPVTYRITGHVLHFDWKIMNWIRFTFAIFENVCNGDFFWTYCRSLRVIGSHFLKVHTTS
jgi:hypothetical protein